MADNLPFEVPWSEVPVSEPVLPGERSDARRREQGWPVYVPALVATIAEVSTTTAQALIDRGEVLIDGEVAPASFVYIRPGAIVQVGPDRRFRLAEP